MGTSRSREKRRAALLGACLALTLAHSGASRAQAPISGYPDSIYAFDPREVAMLPRYCIYTQQFRAIVPGGDSPEEMKRWYASMGPVFHHMHHYCFALMDINRATVLTRDPTTRLFYLHNAVSEFDYVLRAAPPDFFMIPEILTRKGQVMSLLGRGAVGVEQFKRAIEMNPDYWAPYGLMSDYYREAGDLGKAREILVQGLTRSPDAPGLKRRLADLDAEPAQRKSAPRAGAKQ